MRTQLPVVCLCLLLAGPTQARDSLFVRNIGGWSFPDGYALGLAVSGSYAYVGWGDDTGDSAQGLRIISVADPTQPVQVGYVWTPAKAYDVAIEGDHAYVAAGYGGLRIISVADPVNPVEVGYYVKPGRAIRVAVAGGFVYLTDADSGGLRIFSVADPSHPVLVGYHDRPRRSSGVAVSGDYAFVLSDSLYVFSVSDPANPVVVGTCQVFAGSDVAVCGYYAYAAGAGRMLQVFRVADPSHPVHVWSSGADMPGFGVVVEDGRAHVAASNYGLRVMSVADVAHPYEVGYYDLNHTFYSAAGVAAAGDYVYVAYRDAGLQVFQYYGAGVEESPRPQASGHKPAATVLSGASGVKRLASGVVFDAMGRRVANPRAGVFFVREWSAVTKVLVTR